GGREALALQRRKIVTHQAPELRGGAEGAVRGLQPDARKQLVETGLAIGRGRLHIQQTWQCSRQLELVLQPRDRHVRANLAVSLPVEADEDVALSQVRAVQLPRRGRPRPKLEQHRRQPQRRDRPRNSPPPPRPPPPPPGPQ